MEGYGLPLLYTLLVWWLSTGLILYLDGLPRRTFAWSMLGATLVAGGALWGLVASSDQPSAGGAYLAFSSALLLWGWQEMAFLTGFLTGPRTTPASPGCSGWGRFREGVQACLYHELAIIAGAGVVLVATWDAPNQVGTWTFLALWAMRQSAKLNLFLGVPNLNEHFLPEHLRYLGSFFSRRPMNLLFPVSVTAQTVALVMISQTALAPETDAFPATGCWLLMGLLALGLLEHWVMVLPLPFAALWNWSLRSRPPSPPADATPSRSGLPDSPDLALSNPGSAAGPSFRWR